MKKTYSLFVMILACNFVFAQTEVPNGQLENWYLVTNPVNAGVDFWQPGLEPTDNWMTSLNELAMIPLTAGGPGPITVYRTDDKHSGTYAAKLVSAVMPLGVVSVFIPGMLGTATLDMVGVRAILGRGNSGRPLNFKGFYKFEPIAGDSCTAILLVSKWNSTLNKRDTVGYGQQIFRNPISDYTAFDVPISYEYPAGLEIPDSMTLLTISSAGFSNINFMNGEGQVGSTMYVDDLILEYPLGIQQHLMPEISVSSFPNPATETVIFEATKKIDNARIQIISSTGDVIGNLAFNDIKITYNTTTLSKGLYLYRLLVGKNILTSGSFIKK